jgi:membrane associated rhomboid family serine protease
MVAPSADGVIRLALRGRAPIALHATGLRHPRLAPFGGEVFTPYDEITHVVLGSRGLRIATRRRTLTIPRGAFAEPGHAPLLASLLRERVAALPDGAARLARMRALDRRIAEPGRPWVARGLLLACVAVYALQVFAPAAFQLAGDFSADLVRAGEWWRLVTGNFLHGGAAHLLLNGLGLLVLGSLVEMTLGRAGALFVVAASGLGAMAGCYAAGYVHALGASGIVAGLVGALLWTEIRRPESIPATWRIPRWILLAAIAGDTILLAFVPGVAHWAHAAGFAAGAAAASAAAPSLERAGPPRWLRVADAAALGLAGLAALTWAWAAFSPDSVAARERAERLLALEGVHPAVLNNEAWLVATSREPDPELLALARRLAERAVEATGRSDPNVLDTLAEVYFARGERTRALRVIDEAIALAPEEPYFQEQRRRFTGERDAEDRPEPPHDLPPPREPPRRRPRAPDVEPEPGVRV